MVSNDPCHLHNDFNNEEECHSHEEGKAAGAAAAAAAVEVACKHVGHHGQE
jgi:hypothetical protein